MEYAAYNKEFCHERWDGFFPRMGSLDSTLVEKLADGIVLRLGKRAATIDPMKRLLQSHDGSMGLVYFPTFT